MKLTALIASRPAIVTWRRLPASRLASSEPARKVAASGTGSSVPNSMTARDGDDPLPMPVSPTLVALERSLPRPSQDATLSRGRAAPGSLLPAPRLLGAGQQDAPEPAAAAAEEGDDAEPRRGDGQPFPDLGDGVEPAVAAGGAVDARLPRSVAPVGDRDCGARPMRWVGLRVDRVVGGDLPARPAGRKRKLTTS
jgi:hypothetical protein